MTSSTLQTTNADETYKKRISIATSHPLVRRYGWGVTDGVRVQIVLVQHRLPGYCEGDHFTLSLCVQLVEPRNLILINVEPAFRHPAHATLRVGAGKRIDEENIRVFIDEFKVTN